MMESVVSTVGRFTSACGRGLSRLGAWVAGFTFWQFALISILALAAAGIVDSLLWSDHRIHNVRIKRDKAEVRIDKDGIVIRPRAPDAPPAIGETPSDEEAEAEAEEIPVPVPKRRESLPEWMVALLAILWVLRVATRSRAKAEARAEQAESRAQCETLERQLTEARLQALQAQVEPHFLFNTLAAVEHLIETDPGRAAVMQRHLIAFLRGALPRMRAQATTLGDEVELCRNYLAIMKIRMEDRLEFAVDVPSDLLSQPFPPLMLQSLVENAVKHGLEPKPEGGSLMISACRTPGRLRVTVADSGLGFGNTATAGSGIGLANIRERLAGLFGDTAALAVSPNVPTGAQVSIEVPNAQSNSAQSSNGQSDSDHRR